MFNLIDGRRAGKDKKGRHFSFNSPLFIPPPPTFATGLCASPGEKVLKMLSEAEKGKLSLCVYWVFFSTRNVGRVGYLPPLLGRPKGGSWGIYGAEKL